MKHKMYNPHFILPVILQHIVIKYQLDKVE